MPVRFELDPVVTAPPAFPLLRRVPCYEPQPEQPGRRASRVPAFDTPAVSVLAVPQPLRPTPVNPAALVRAQQVFRLTFEVLEGRRGPRQLQQLMAPEVLAKITTLARANVGQRARSTARLHRVHVQQVTPRIAEACVTVDRGARVHAVAARLDLDRGGWRCTALLIG